MSSAGKSIIDPDPPKPGIPVRRSTLLVLAGLVVLAAFLAALVLESTTPTPSAAPGAAGPSTTPADSGSKIAIDEELKKAKEAADEEERKRSGQRLNQPGQTSAQGSPAVVQPVVTGAQTGQSPLPPGVSRNNQDGALYDNPAASRGMSSRNSAVTGNGRAGDDFELEAQVRSAKSLAFDEGDASSLVGQSSPTALALAGLSGGNNSQRAIAALPDLLAAATNQPPSAAVQGTLDRALGSLRAAQGAGGPVQTSGMGNTGWVNEYASASSQKSAETIKPNPTASPFTLHQGKVIPAVLGRQINSDLPGEITAYVVTNVFDSLGNGALLIPKGSVLVGRYNSDVKPGQERVLFAFNRLIMPNGQSFDLPGAQGSDLAGASGTTGDVNNHFLKMFGASFFTAWLADRVTAPTTTNGLTGNTSVSPAGQVLVDVSKTILDRNRTIPPTITVDQGTRINVEVKRDMEFSGPYSWSKK